jgi:FdrA protein
MIQKVIVRRGAYFDSAQLMQLGRALGARPGVAEAIVIMGTEMNRGLLAQAGFDPGDATPMDLVVAVRAEDERVLEATLADLEGRLSGREAAATRGVAGGAARVTTLDAALALQPETNLVSVAVPGRYAAFVAHRALDAGRSVFLFSDNVPLEDEVALKQRAAAAGLLVMGPDCGTAILGGVCLGFANRVRRGDIGVVGASGTGIQELTCAVHRLGRGISHAIGTGSHDLSAAVGGLMTLSGLQLLADDPGTATVVLVAKQPDPAVVERVHERLARLGKPVVVRYLGQERGVERDGVRYSASLDEAAEAAVARPRQSLGEGAVSCATPADVVQRLRTGPGPLAGTLVGLYGGGSLASEATRTLRRSGLAVETPAEEVLPTSPALGQAHLVVDTGDDCYTVGRPHPMVDQAVRCRLITAAAGHPGVAALLLDCVLGDGAHLDPAPELAAALQAGRAARPPGAPPLVALASITGTDLDPQDARRQREHLEAAGVQVLRSAHQAACVAAALVTGKEVNP